MVKEPNSVAIIIPCHNYGHYLAECLDSVLTQTIVPRVVVIINDDSSDNTQDVFIEYQDKFKTRFHYFNVSYNHVHSSRMRGAELTVSDYLIFLDADDILEPTYIEDCLECFISPDAPQNLGIVYSDVCCFGEVAECEESIIWNQQEFDGKLLQEHNYICVGAMVSRAALQTSGVMKKESPDQCFADWWMWKEVVKAGYVGKKQRKSMYRYRIHSDSMMQRHLAEKKKTDNISI